LVEVLRKYPFAFYPFFIVTFKYTFHHLLPDRQANPSFRMENFVVRRVTNARNGTQVYFRGCTPFHQNDVSEIN
jgi:hypothetical protein